jgi:hypothetical protein
MSAIFADVDVLISGDRDFEGVKLNRPKILTVAEFMNLFYAADEVLANGGL